MKQTLKATLFLTAFATYFNVSAQDVKITSNIPEEVEAGKEFTVELTVNKGDVSGFAKLQQDLPVGLTATPDNPNGSTFSFKEQKVKFLWMALPGDKTFKVSYKVKVDPSVSGDQIFEGTFSYIMNNETQKAPLPKDIIKVNSAGTAAANQTAAQPKVTSVETPHQSAETASSTTSSQSNSGQASSSPSSSASASSSSDQGVNTSANNTNAEAQAAAKRKEEEAKQLAAKQEQDRKNAEIKAKTIAAETPKSAPKTYTKVSGLVYRVQVAATKRKVDGSEFKTQFNLSDNVAWEEHEGWNKYIVGEFQNYKAAKAYSNNIRDNNGVPGPFVTSYQDGVRISVQEALEKQGH